MSARIEEVDDEGRPIKRTDEEQEDEHSGEGEEAASDENVEAAEPSSKTTTSKGKKSKKKKAKKAKGQNVPQEVVDLVATELRAKGGTSVANEEVDETAIRLALEQMKLMDVLKGKSGIGGKNKKEIGEHKFWSTQPVPQLGEGLPQEDGPIEPSKDISEVRQTAYPLPKDFEWVMVDVTDPIELKELYELLSANYVEDDDASFRFNYSAEFLKWALMPPGWLPEWHVGVRVAKKETEGGGKKGRLVAFISAIPVKLRVRDNVLNVSEVNFLCVHKKLRSKRLAPVLIKEVTRQCHLKGIWQAIYTAGVVIPTPISVCRYYHRSLNVPKLVDIKFTGIPRGSTIARMSRQFSLPSVPKLMSNEQSELFKRAFADEGTASDSTPATSSSPGPSGSNSSGLREMEERDILQVTKLWERYMARFGMSPVFEEEDVRHWLLSGRGEGEVKKGRREGQVVWSYVFEDPTTHDITDYFSFYTLPSTVTSPTSKHPILDAAYLFYYATDMPFKTNGELLLKRRLEDLIGDAMIVAKKAGFDVFNALTLMDNCLFLSNLKFGSGDGLLNFYMYNWRTAPLAGIEPMGDTPAGRGIGVVML